MIGSCDPLDHVACIVETQASASPIQNLDVIGLLLSEGFSGTVLSAGLKK